MPLISMRRVAASGASPSWTGSASEPPARIRYSSIVRSAVRAARPTSSGRVFRLSSSSMTVSGMTTSTLRNPWKQVGSAAVPSARYVFLEPDLDRLRPGAPSAPGVAGPASSAESPGV